MANTIDSSLYPNIYAAAYRAARKQQGFITSVASNFSGTPYVMEAGEDKNYITIPIAGGGTAGNYTPAQTVTVGGNTTDTTVKVQITENRYVPFHVTADERRSLDAGAQNSRTLFEQKIQRAMETLCDELEEDIAGNMYKWASRARGTAGTTPFASSLAPLSAANRELDDNGAPSGDRFFVMDAAASENFANLAIVQQANVAASDAFLRQGTLLDHLGFAIKVSRKIAAHTKGTATGMDCTAVEPVGEDEIEVDGANSGTVLAGDVITRGVEGGSSADANKYVLADTTQEVSGAASGTLIINDPGVKVATTITDEWTIGSNYTPNMAFQKDGYAIVVRPPAIDPTPIIRVMTIQDQISGLPFTICECLGDGLTTWRVHLAWGYKGVNSNFIVTYMG